MDTQKARSNHILCQMREFADTNGITLAQGAGYLLFRHYWNVDKGIARLGAELFGGSRHPSQVSEVDPLKCLWLVSRNNISRARYTNLRLVLLKHVRLQPFSFLSELRMSFTPQLHPYPVDCDPAMQRGVFVNLGEAVRIVMQRMIQFGGSEWLPCCDREGSQCANVVAKIHCSGDGRGDEKQYSQRSQVDLDTSHVLSFVFSIPRISLALPPTDQLSPKPPLSVPLSAAQLASTASLYSASEVLPELRLLHTGYPSRNVPEEDGIKVWSLSEDLEDIFINSREPESKRQRLDDRRPDDQQEEEEENEPSELEQLAKQIRKPLGFQVSGDVLWKEMEPQSSRAAHPWAISVERETSQNVKALWDHIINPQVPSHFCLKYITIIHHSFESVTGGREEKF